MVVRSAGILLYRCPTGGGVEVLLAHPGGPLWAKRDRGAWTVPKGEIESGERPLDAAHREFEEELGLPVPAGPTHHLGEVRQSGGKLVEAWAVDADLDPDDVVPGTFEMQWPPGSGERRSFPEVDRVAWFELDEAEARILDGQRRLLTRLQELLDG